MPLTPAANSRFAKGSAGDVHIFLDLDGVLADFEGHAQTQGKYTDDGKIKWDALDRDWYATMPIYDGARGLYDAAKELGTVKFLTAPVLKSDSFSGKADWVQKFVPEEGKFILKHLIICGSDDKDYFAGPGRILIDDREKNVAAWVAAGGIGIHHTGDFKETLRKLEAEVAKLSALKARKGRLPTSASKPGF